MENGRGQGDLSPVGEVSEQTCIWCGGAPADSLEHIAPEALGCPPNFVLPRGVCTKCNQRNGRLDRALLTPFEIVTVLKGIPRKKGKRPTVDGFSSLSSSYNEDGPIFYINREKYSVQIPGGKQLGGVNANDPIVNAAIKNYPDGTAEVSYKQELRFDRKAVRGLFKIAVEAIAFFEGLDAARDTALNGVKHFVTEGAGQFKAIIMVDQNSIYDSYFAPCAGRAGFSRVYGMTILGIGFLCDFDSEFKGGAMLLEEAKKQSVSAQIIPNWPRTLWAENNAIGI